MGLNINNTNTNNLSINNSVSKNKAVVNRKKTIKKKDLFFKVASEKEIKDIRIEAYEYAF